MTRDELEAVIRRELAVRDRELAIHDGTYADNALTDRVLAAAAAFAVAEARSVLRETDRRLRQPGDVPPPAVHLAHPIACRTSAIDPQWTRDPARVTCRACQRTGAFARAQAATP
jgi:hypothetical protein